MAFKNSKQRKAAFARMKNSNYQQLQTQGIFLKKTGDADKDGVINIKDCKPLDPKKQGFLHDLQIKRLKAKEEKIERIREKELKKLEDIKDTLKARSAIAKKTSSLKQVELRQKQSVIDEINKEKRQLAAIKKANKDAKIALDKLTISGKAKTAIKNAGIKIGTQAYRDSKLALQAGNAFLHKKSTKKTLKKIKKTIFG